VWLRISRRTLGESLGLSVVTHMPCQICRQVQDAGSFCAQMTIWRVTTSRAWILAVHVAQVVVDQLRKRRRPKNNPDYSKIINAKAGTEPSQLSFCKHGIQTDNREYCDRALAQSWNPGKSMRFTM
jgi:hypothetical protein